jgi:uncharacterized protein YjiS (DUF1127 family)
MLRAGIISRSNPMPPQQTSLAAAGNDAARQQDTAITTAITAAITPAIIPGAAARDAPRSEPFVAAPDAVAPEILSNHQAPLRARLWRNWLAWRQQRRLRAAVHELSDEQLKDIGLTRGELDALSGHRAAIDTLSPSAMQLWLMSRGRM